MLDPTVGTDRIADPSEVLRRRQVGAGRGMFGSDLVLTREWEGRD